MKAKLLKPAEMLNPLYSQSDAQQAKARGEVYDTPVVLTLPVGHVIDDPDAWRACMPDNRIAVPDDDECAKALAARLDDAGRKSLLAMIRKLQQPEVRKQLGKQDAAWLEAMEEWHEDELTAVSSQ